MAPSVEAIPQAAVQAKNIDAAPAVDDRVKRNELKELEIADQMGGEDMYVDGEVDTCWYNWVGSIWVKPYRFENRSGTYVIALKTEPHAELGKHRHRGEVRAFTVKGQWGYHE